MPRLSNPDLLLNEDIKHLKTYVLGKDELEKPRELSEQEKKDIAHREMYGLNWHDPASDQELANNTKRDAMQLIQNPSYRAGYDMLMSGISGLTSGSATGAGVHRLIAKNPSIGGTLLSMAAGGALGVLPPLLTNAVYYERQKFVNDVVKEYIKNHSEGQIVGLSTVYQEMLAKKRKANSMNTTKKTVKTSADFEDAFNSPELKKLVEEAKKMYEASGGKIPKGNGRTFKSKPRVEFEFPKYEFQTEQMNSLNKLNKILGGYTTVIGGTSLVSNAVQNLWRYNYGKQELDDLKDRFERKKKSKEEADILLNKVKTPLYKKHKTEKNKLDEFDNLFKSSAEDLPLQEHQQRVVDRLMKSDQPGLIAYHMMGSGKTRASLEAYKNLKLPTEVIVPASLKGNYEKEIHKWVGKHPKNLHVDSQQNIARNAPDEHAYDGKLMIVDETHRLRNQDSKTYQHLKNTNPAKRLLLTGTPIYNDVSDIAKLVNLASGKDILPERKAEFEKEYVGTKVVFPSFVHRFLGVQPGQELHIKNKEFLKKVFDKMIDYHGGTSEDFPEVTHETVKVPMSTHQQEVYNAVMKKLPWYMRMKVQAGLPPDKKELDKLIPFLTGARMIANSTGGFEKDPSKIESPKIDKAVEFLKQKIDEDPTYKGVVYSNYLDAGVNAYKKKLQETGIPYGEFTGEINDKVRNQLVKDYNANKIKALLISSAASEGLDLRGTRLMQILEPHFNNEKIEQVQARGIRYKSHSDLPPEKRNVLVQHYLSTINPSIYDKLTSSITGSKNLSSDEYLQNMSDEKSKLNNAFLDLIRKK